MKSRTLTYVTAMTVFAVLVAPIRSAAQSREGQNHGPARYKVVNLGTLGGINGSGASGINNKGWVTGGSDLSGDQTQHAFLWRKDYGITDLGTLGGPNSAVNWPVNDDAGLIAGVSDISTTDPNGENFCGLSPSGFDPQICLGFRWQNGVMTPLPTLGGNNSYAFGANNRGQIVGLAENSTRDPNCIAPQVLDWEAVIWGPKPGEIHQLPLLPGDVVAGATAINDKGQAVGTSGDVCVGVSALSHAVLWQDGSVTDLGSLGGALNNVALAINNQGQVVGDSNLPGEITHAFLWQNGAMTDLGVLPGDTLSYAYAINSRGEVVGDSTYPGYDRAFVWHDGVMMDLNTLACSGSSLYLFYGGDINDRGEIVGGAFDLNAGAFVSFLAVPTDGEDGCEANLSAGQEVVLPENVGERLQQRHGFGRFAASPMRQQ
jgi:probable HAF family extracellular repeat protein